MCKCDILSSSPMLPERVIKFQKKQSTSHMNQDQRRTMKHDSMTSSGILRLVLDYESNAVQPEQLCEILLLLVLQIVLVLLNKSFEIMSNNIIILSYSSNNFVQIRYHIPCLSTIFERIFKIYEHLIKPNLHRNPGQLER